MRALIFPGQGSQFIGMGKDLADAFPEAREVFEQVNDALSQKLFALMTSGAESDLNLTENTQPALMAVSMACKNFNRPQAALIYPNHQPSSQVTPSVNIPRSLQLVHLTSQPPPNF